ncbi:MAG: hypothetical protein M1815_002842 [Lichina confinis]|nr:MAG: hypothetical protein M1815_002842 [Lichina confinis]
MRPSIASTMSTVLVLLVAMIMLAPSPAQAFPLSLMGPHTLAARWASPLPSSETLDFRHVLEKRKKSKSSKSRKSKKKVKVSGGVIAAIVVAIVVVIIIIIVAILLRRWLAKRRANKAAT